MNDIPLALLNLFTPPTFFQSYFLSFEGIEGAGKSTQITLLKKYLEEEKKYRVLVLREPGGTLFGEKLRQVILEAESDISPLAEAHLFLASRSELLSKIILPELNIPKTIIILDRYLDSSLVYQGLARGLGIKNVLEMHQVFPLNLTPHLTFYLRIEALISEERQMKRNSKKDYFESKGMDFYNKLVLGYDSLLMLFPKRMIKLNAEENETDIFLKIKKIIDQLIVE